MARNEIQSRVSSVWQEKLQKFLVAEGNGGSGQLIFEFFPWSDLFCSGLLTPFLFMSAAAALALIDVISSLKNNGATDAFEVFNINYLVVVLLYLQTQDLKIHFLPLSATVCCSICTPKSVPYLHFKNQHKHTLTHSLQRTNIHNLIPSRSPVCHVACANICTST